MDNNKIPCGGFYYDDTQFAFSKDADGHIVLKKRPVVEKIADYFYVMDYDTYDYADGYKYAEGFEYDAGACSAVRVGDLIGRNLDWYYGEEVEVLIRTKATQGRHATIGIAHGSLTKEQVESGKWTDYYNVLPFMTSDCMNDVGVYASSNIVPAGDKGLTLGTNVGKQDLCQIMIPRFVCDYADSAKNAIALLQDMNIFAPLSKIGYECHILLCDAVDTYVIEFVDNQMSILSSTDDDYDAIPNDMDIVTNFYLTGWDGNIKAVYAGNTKAEVDATGLTPHSQGLERYTLLADGYDNVVDIDDMGALLEDVKYTLTYNESQNPYWYSEFVDGDLTIYSTEQDFSDIKAKAIEAFENRTRDKKTWYSAHSSIYDIENKKLAVYINEDFTKKYEFKLNVLGEI